MLKALQYLLLPFSFLYWLILKIRNWLFDKMILRSAAFNFPIICVGNLSVGGTGKTPMTEYLVRLLGEKFKVATLSRGYKRKTRGFALADENSTAIEIGDEPMQIHRKFPAVAVSVAEERLVGIPQLLHARPETEVIILDDAFQHREIRAGLNILLTSFDNPYTNDSLLPTGRLRDVRSSSKRANIIVVTKCPGTISLEEAANMRAVLNPLETQKLYFAKIVYDTPYHLFSNEPKFLLPETAILLVCGIANPKPLLEALSYAAKCELIQFGDHHIFNLDDLEKIKTRFESIENRNKMILTTEKDGVRLLKYVNELSNLPVYVLPMRHEFLFDTAQVFESEVKDFMRGYTSKDSNN